MKWSCQWLERYKHGVPASSCWRFCFWEALLSPPLSPLSPPPFPKKYKRNDLVLKTRPEQQRPEMDSSSIFHSLLLSYVAATGTTIGMGQCFKNPVFQFVFIVCVFVFLSNFFFFFFFSNFHNTHPPAENDRWSRDLAFS